MKTIEERATDYACDDGVMPDSYDCESCFNIYGKCTRDAYIAGAKSEHEGLTRWHDPKEPPTHINTVLVKVEEGVYNTGHYDSDFGGFFIGSDFYYSKEVVGWREIHE